jgi:hypothetical protein
MPMGDRLIKRKVLKDGRVIAINTWKTGWQELVYASEAQFERAKEAVEKEGAAPYVTAYAPV